MTFLDMVTLLQPRKQGVASLNHFTPDEMDIFQCQRRGQDADENPVVTLNVNGRLMMSDGIVKAATGRVLIGGLGIGMILPPILRKPDVTHVVVIERYQDVVDIVLPQLADLPGIEKLHVITADILTWRPEKGTKFNCIYFDIWPDICTDNLIEMAKLHRAFARYKAEGAYMDSWCRDLLKSRKRSEARNPWRI